MSAIALSTNDQSLVSNVDAEQALLGAALYDNSAVALCDGIVLPEHFAEPFHGWLWAKIRETVDRGGVADPISIDAIAQGYGGAYEDLGGVRYLAELVDHCPPAVNAPDWARPIFDCFVRRNLLQACAEASQATLRERDRPAFEIVAKLRQVVEEIEVSGGAEDSWSSAGPTMREAIAQAQTRTGIIDFPTGIRALDTLTGGLHAGETTLLAARPGMGKSVGALTVARACAQIGLGVAIFSLEMTKEALLLRIACDVAYDRSMPAYSGLTSNATFDKAMKGELDRQQWGRLAEANEEVDRWTLEIDDRAGLTVAQIEGATRRLHRKWARQGIKPGPIIIDHLGKVRPSNDRKGNKSAEVADVSNEIMTMAKRLNVPVLALVQLNRAIESREDKQPQLSDLRQAGELEEDARQVIFLYRPAYYLRDPVKDETFEERTARMDKLQACTNDAYWVVEKNSHGARGQVKAYCEIACSAFRDW